ncbi:MAG: hypothetical protein ACOYJ6_02030 [Caulobacterales bacterium]|jgi:hypothetical protein
MHPSEMLLRRCLKALEAQDYDLAATCFAPEARIWRCVDPIEGPEKASAENISVLRWVGGFQRRLNSQLRWFQTTPDGFAATHVLSAQTVLGDLFSLSLTMRAIMRDAKIQCLEEHFDAAAMSPLRNAIAASCKAKLRFAGVAGRVTC